MCKFESHTEGKVSNLSHTASMGNQASNEKGGLLKRLFTNKEVRILMLGLDNAGKTTILYNLKMGKVVRTIPTIGEWYIC